MTHCEALVSVVRTLLWHFTSPRPANTQDPQEDAILRIQDGVGSCAGTTLLLHTLLHGRPLPEVDGVRMLFVKFAFCCFWLDAGTARSWWCSLPTAARIKLARMHAHRGLS